MFFVVACRAGLHAEATSVGPNAATVTAMLQACPSNRFLSSSFTLTPGCFTNLISEGHCGYAGQRLALIRQSPHGLSLMPCFGCTSPGCLVCERHPAPVHKFRTGCTIGGPLLLTDTTPCSTPHMPVSLSSFASQVSATPQAVMPQLTQDCCCLPSCSVALFLVLVLRRHPT